MKLYDTVVFKEKIEEYDKGTIGIIIEIYNNKTCYIEVLDSDGDSIDVLYDVPIDKIEIKK